MMPIGIKLRPTPDVLGDLLREIGRETRETVELLRKYRAVTEDPAIAAAIGQLELIQFQLGIIAYWDRRN